MQFDAARLYHYTKGALSEQLQIIASEAHLLLVSTSEDDPRREGLLAVDQAAKMAITLFQNLLKTEDFPP